MAGWLWHHLEFTDKLESDGKKEDGCWLCKKSVLESRGYKCRECKIFLHESCPEPIDKKEIKAQQHNLSETHHLISMNELNNNRENKVACSMCEEPVSCLLGNNGPTIYKCSIPNCSFRLHQSCVELPYMTTHSLHISNHMLYLEPPIETKYCCCACGKLFSRRFFYKCYDCDYRIDIICGSRWRNISVDKCNPHAFIPTRNPISITCEVCGNNRPEIVYHCSNCLILIHSDCAKFLGTIKIRGHGHSLTCTFPLSQGKEHKCKVCKGKVDTMYAAYCCDNHKCDYIAHLQCAYWFRKVGETSDSLDYATHLVEGNDLKDDEKAPRQMIEHSSHPQHKLIFKNEELQDVKHCEGCRQFIVLPQFYDCAQCKFSLHLRCTKLPQEIMRPLHHEHPLTLCNVVGRLRRCWACHRRRRGFSYKCVDGCFHEFDAQCILIPEAFNHKGHRHCLFLDKINQPKCSACGQRPFHAQTFACNDCEFRLCIQCATLPLVTRHGYDTHLLHLTYGAEDDSREYYCQICEEERDGKLWFYYCKNCDFAAHPRCILSKTWQDLCERGMEMKYLFV